MDNNNYELQTTIDDKLRYESHPISQPRNSYKPTLATRVAKYALAAGLTMFGANGCSTLAERNARYDRSEIVYNADAWNPSKASPEWSRSDAGIMTPIFNWFREENPPSLTGSKATFIRPTNYAVWAPRAPLRGMEELFNLCAPVYQDDFILLKGWKYFCEGGRLLFGFLDRVVHRPASVAGGDQTARALTPGAYENEHPGDDTAQHLHRAKDAALSGAVLGSIGAGVVFGTDDDSSRRGSGIGGGQDGGPAIGGGQTGGNGVR